MRIKQFGPGDGWHHPEAGKTTKLGNFKRNCAEVKQIASRDGAGLPDCGGPVMNADSITVLEARPGVNLAKTWMPDEAVKEYDDALWFRVVEHEIGDFDALCCVLAEIETAPNRCAIRGKLRANWQEVLDAKLPKWNEERKRAGKEETKQPGRGWVMRRLELFEDVPHHWFMCDIDNFPAPFDLDAFDPYASFDPYMKALPPGLRDASFRWQMSNSAGHPKYAGKLKAHLWFWTDAKHGSAELTAWGQSLNEAYREDRKARGLPTEHAPGKPYTLVDTALFRTVQVHYTAAPVFAAGVVDPIAQRGGVVNNLAGNDTATLVLSAEVRRKASAPTKAKEELKDPREKDGVIGAVHRAFTVEDVVERWLPDIVEWVTDYRLTWNLGGGAAEGVYVRGDRQGLGASHNTWPWGVDRTANLFDLVRYFVFGHLDDTTDNLERAIYEHNPADRPSFKAAVEMFSALAEVQDELRSPDSEEMPLSPITGEVCAPQTTEAVPFPAPFPGPMADAVAAALAAAPKPQPELSTLAALIGMAACCPGYYHLPGGGRLNLYGVGIAGTGWGKDLPRNVAVEIAKSGGARLLGKPASGQGLEDAVVPFVGTLCEVDEIAHLFEALNGTNKPPYLVELAGAMLRLFSASAGTFNTRVRAKVKGNDSGRAVANPCVSLIGFATPEKLGQAVSVTNIDDGLLGRVLYSFGRDGVPPRRTVRKFALPGGVTEAAARLRQAAGTLDFDGDLDGDEVGRQITIKEGVERQLDALLHSFDDRARNASTPFGKALLQRSFEKCERVAGVLAVWDDPKAPVMTTHHISWAAQLVEASDTAALHFCGEYMHGGQIQADASLVLKTVRRILKGDIRPQRKGEFEHVKAGMVPRSFALRASKLDRRRFDEAIAHLVDLGELSHAHTEGEQSNGKKTRTHALRLAEVA